MDYKRSVCMNPNGKKIWLQQQYIPCAQGNIQKKKRIEANIGECMYTEIGKQTTNRKHIQLFFLRLNTK